MFYVSMLTFFPPIKQEGYFSIFFYGVVFYIAIFYFLNADIFESSVITSFIKDNLLYLMLGDFSYLFYRYTGHKKIQSVKITEESKEEIDTDTDSITFSIIDSDNDVKISQQSDKSASINLSGDTTESDL